MLGECVSRILSAISEIATVLHIATNNILHMEKKRIINDWHNTQTATAQKLEENSSITEEHMTPFPEWLKLPHFFEEVSAIVIAPNWSYWGRVGESFYVSFFIFRKKCVSSHFSPPPTTLHCTHKVFKSRPWQQRYFYFTEGWGFKITLPTTICVNENSCFQLWNESRMRPVMLEYRQGN